MEETGRLTRSSFRKASGRTDVFKGVTLEASGHIGEVWFAHLEMDCVNRQKAAELNMESRWNYFCFTSELLSSSSLLPSLFLLALFSSSHVAGTCCCAGRLVPVPHRHSCAKERLWFSTEASGDRLRPRHLPADLEQRLLLSSGVRWLCRQVQ